MKSGRNFWRSRAASAALVSRTWFAVDKVERSHWHLHLKSRSPCDLFPEKEIGRQLVGQTTVSRKRQTTKPDRLPHVGHYLFANTAGDKARPISGSSARCITSTASEHTNTTTASANSSP